MRFGPVAPVLAVALLFVPGVALATGPGVIGQDKEPCGPPYVAERVPHDSEPGPPEPPPRVRPLGIDEVSRVGIRAALSLGGLPLNGGGAGFAHDSVADAERRMKQLIRRLD